MDKCQHCDKYLYTCKEIHAVEGTLYCSKECAVASQTDVIIQTASAMANEWYNDCAEVVKPEDIGIKKPCLTTQQIMQIFERIAKSNGLYYRLCLKLKQFSADDRESLLQELADEHFNDEVDLIIFMETKGE